MRFALVVSFLSTFQIYHQSAPYATMGFNMTKNELSLISASFLMGKFFGTLATPLIYKRYSNAACLDANALFLTIGAFLMLLPSCAFLCIGRLIADQRRIMSLAPTLLAWRVETRIGVGMGFVSASIAIKDCTEFAQRQQVFLVAAIFFSGSALFSGFLVFLHGISYFHFVFLLTLPSFLAVAIYLLNRNEYKEPEKDRTITIAEPQYALFNPRFLAFVLMALNAAIGVPVILCFSSLIFVAIGIEQDRAAILTILYPLVQIFVIFIANQLGEKLNRRKTILYGYGVCLGIFFILLLTQVFETLKTEKRAKTTASAFWFIALAVATALPCNSGVCVISECFKSRYSLIRGTAQSRAFFWFLSAMSCGTFLPMLLHGSLFTALIPSFCLSLICFVYVLFVLPEDDELSSALLQLQDNYGSTQTTFLY